MHFEVLVSAVAKELRAAWPEIGEPGDVLIGRRGGCLVQVDCGHAFSLLFCSSKLRRVRVKNKVAIFAGLVAKKARLVHGLVVGFAVSELNGLGEGDPSVPM